MLTINDLKQTRMTARNVGLILLGILIPVTITLVSYGSTLSRQIAVLDAGWRENRGRIERIEGKIDVLVDRVHFALDENGKSK